MARWIKRQQRRFSLPPEEHRADIKRYADKISRHHDNFFPEGDSCDLAFEDLTEMHELYGTLRGHYYAAGEPPSNQGGEIAEMMIRSGNYVRATDNIFRARCLKSPLRRPY